MSSDTTPRVITVGMFDGVHLGHKSVIQETIREAKKIGGVSEVVTFENHPSSLLYPENKKLLIVSHAHKMQLIQQLNPDKVTSLPFTRELSDLSAEAFLSLFKPKALILGYDARIGKGRSGDRAHLEELSQKMGFTLRYLPPLEQGGAPISSSRIREAIARGDLEEASRLLGRPYSG